MRALVGHLENVRKHPNADRLDLVDFVSTDQIFLQNTGSKEKPHKIWITLVTGQHYKDGERGLFIPVGEIVPDELADEMELLGLLGGENKNVVEEKDMRGITSKGLFYGEVGPSWYDEWEEGEWIEFYEFQVKTKGETCIRMACKVGESTNGFESANMTVDR